MDFTPDAPVPGRLPDRGGSPPSSDHGRGYPSQLYGPEGDPSPGSDGDPSIHSSHALENKQTIVAKELHSLRDDCLVDKRRNEWVVLYLSPDYDINIKEWEASRG